MIKKLTILFLILIVTSCKKENVDGIIIGETLLVHQSVSQNHEMTELIKRALKKDKNAIVEIINFPNGGAASSYDLGYVLTQIIYRIGVNEFADVLRKLSKSERNGIEGLIAVGLEYGDNNYDGKMDNDKIENAFPELIEVLMSTKG